MSPLALIKRSLERQEAVRRAQMAHLKATAYRGVDTTMSSKPFPVKRDQKVLTYRGTSYLG